MNTLLLVLLILLLLGAFGAMPQVGMIPHNYGGRLPTVAVVLIVVLLVLVLTGRL